MKKFISIYNLDFLELSGAELQIILFMIWHRDNHIANKQYASSSKIAAALGKTQRSIFNTLKTLEEKEWIERVNGEYYINANSMSLMIDKKNDLLEHTMDRSKKSYLHNPEVIQGFIEMYPTKRVKNILQMIINDKSRKIYNYHEYAKKLIESSKDKIEKVNTKNNGWWNK